HRRCPRNKAHLAHRLVNRPTTAFPTVQPTYRLPAQEVEPTRPRLPVREWQNTPVTEALTLPGAKDAPEQGLEQRQPGKLNRSTLEQLEAQMRQQPVIERV